MLNEEKIKIMNKLAMYEQGEGKKYLPVSRYYRSDYIGLAMIKNFFLVTIGYCLILAGIAAYFAEYLIDNVHKMNLVSIGIEAVVGYGSYSGVCGSAGTVFCPDIYPIYGEIPQSKEKCEKLL